MTGQRKRGAGRDKTNSENLVKRHHPGSVDQIESLCTAITISLLSDGLNDFIKNTFNSNYNIL